jgi:hypothetical protein
MTLAKRIGGMLTVLPLQADLPKPHNARILS